MKIPCHRKRGKKIKVYRKISKNLGKLAEKIARKKNISPLKEKICELCKLMSPKVRMKI